MAAQAKDEWEKAMSELAQEEPELLQHFQKLSEAAGKVGKAYRLIAACFLCLLFFQSLNVTCPLQALTQPLNKSSPPVLKKPFAAWPKMQITCKWVKLDSVSCYKTHQNCADILLTWIYPYRLQD